MGDAFQSQPEFFEVELGESLLSRTETLASFRELGPPDLVHVIKSTGSSARARDIGSYHYVSGVDASSSAALAAYINSLTYELDQNPGFFSSKAAYKLKSGAYCCFNAFSRVDVRVEVRIPGSVDAYVVDLRGERHETTPEIWQEVYLSALLRAILYADDANYRLAGYRKLDPISSPDAEHRFLQAAENLFFKGWQLGSDPEIQVATVVSNHLTAAILKYFGDASRYEQAVNLFEKLWAREPEVAALVARSYIGMNQEIKAVQVMHSAIRETPQSYALLHAQVDFLRAKGKFEWAAKVAKQAVNCAPSEFVTWAKLTECYIDLEQWESALYTLNSCPIESSATAVPGDVSGASDANGGRRMAIVNGEHDASIAMAEARQKEKNTGFSFRDKRLCERWLDNLFMVLYEDLRVYTIWRAEIAHFRTQNLAYRKTGTEWEILGELALRLLHADEAREAFQRCVDVKFSAKAYLRLLEMYTEARDVQRSLWTAIRLTAYHHRWYMEGSFPGAVATSLFKLIRTEGLAKVSYTLVSMSPPQPILKLMQNYFAYATAFKVAGYDF
ncbi:hypothetical protein PANT_3c00031 [Moesziomyces antarcticus T-34]|uniref:Chaps-domain-containing protein n=1 Tax=Pseudozyma antarctica (strain T-34) TaxID=1151754 RepID=M9MC60_PSEA3|nr:hypothetical protein PANT_3c00031 [Moesziomyces antarcticus T-34]